MSDRKAGSPAPEGLIARWSARKAKVREAERVLEERRQSAEAPAVPAAEPDGAGAEAQAGTEDAASAERELTDEDMPPVESLDERSDLSMFFSSKVSEELRRRALRKVFMSAAFNRVDGLDDYAEDFTQFEALGDVMTSDLKHRLEMARERMARALDGETAGDESEVEVASAQAQTQAAADDAETEAEADASAEPSERDPHEDARANIHDDSGGRGA
jgi:hypothetical protein